MSALQTIETSRSRDFLAAKTPAATSQNPPVIVASELKEFVELPVRLWMEAGHKKRQIIRGLKWSQPSGPKPKILFRDIRKLAKLAKQASYHLDEVSKSIPGNMRVNVPTVRVGWIDGNPNEVASVSDIDHIYEQWIEAENAVPDRVAFLRQERIRKITDLVKTTEACLDHQTVNGYWAARVAFDALDRALSRAIYLICHTRPQSMAECDDLLAFLAWQCATKNRHVDELCNGLVLALSRRVRRSIQQLKKGPR